MRATSARSNWPTRSRRSNPCAPSRATSTEGSHAASTLISSHSNIGGYPRHYNPRAAAKIQALHPKLFIAGHSHILKVVYDPVYDLLHVNPGAAGEYGFHKVRTAVRLVIDGADMRDMEVGEWPRK